MSRKLLQDQPLKADIEDMEDVNYFEKQEKKVTFDPKIEDEEIKSKSDRKDETSRDFRIEDLNTLRTEITSSEGRETRERKPNHHMQILDEDAERFRDKLDNMVNKFKTETMSEFMSMKRSLLEDQEETINTETRKYTRILENRNSEVAFDSALSSMVNSWIGPRRA